MMKKLLLELMIWLHSSTGEHQLSQISLYVLPYGTWKVLFLKGYYPIEIHTSYIVIFFEGIWLWERNWDNDNYDQRRISCFIEKVNPISSRKNCHQRLFEIFQVLYILFCFHYRRSSGFSRGVSKYRGVARWNIF